jgi:hypothetical protein
MLNDNVLCNYYREENEDVPMIRELLLIGLGYLNRRPYMFCRVGEDFHLYEAYPFYEDSYENVLKLRFAKVKHHLILRERKS